MPRCKLTARYVESVKADKSQEEHRDVQERGLELRVTRAGVKAWAFRYRRKSDGRKRVVTLGRFPEVSLEEGRTRAREARAAVSRGADPASGVKERRIAPTFADLVAEWQTTHAELNRSGRVRADDRSILKLYILPAIGDMKAHEIGRREISLTLSHVISAIDCRKGHRQGAPRRLTHRANSVFALLLSIMRWAVAQGIILTDPTYGMKKPIKKTTIRDRELSPAEIERS